MKTQPAALAIPIVMATILFAAPAGALASPNHPLDPRSTTSPETEGAVWSSVKALYRGAGRLSAESSVGHARTGQRAGYPGDEEVERAAAPRYPLRTSPENVLLKLEQAYEAKDASAYLDCLAEDFLFYLHPDVWQDPGNDLPQYWGKAEEQTIHENMFGEGSSLLNVTVDLTFMASSFDPGADPVDPSDDRWQYDDNYDVWFYMTGDLVIRCRGGATFIFQVDPTEQGPEGETLWEIVDWWDLDEFDDTPTQTTSWGRLKALFR